MAGTNVPDADGSADRKGDPSVDEVVSALKVHSVYADLGAPDW